MAVKKVFTNIIFLNFQNYVNFYFGNHVFCQKIMHYNKYDSYQISDKFDIFDN